MKRGHIITPKNHIKIATSLASVKFMVKAAIIEHQQYLDVDFRSPNVHNGLKRAVEGMELALSVINKNFLTDDGGEQVEGVEFKLHELISTVMRLEESELDELIKLSTAIRDKRVVLTSEPIGLKDQY